ncbi:hypothetical protein [Stutzerimonas zhaodongensis]|uniref:hypothetical protein n=1 Tax=Stutzerimonas TaxID=2901164 RepID=UPI0038909FD2
MLFDIDYAGWSSVALLLNSMALLIALGGAWLLIATRWRRQLANAKASLATAHPLLVAQAGTAAATERLDRFFYAFGFSSLGLACLLSSLTRLT